MKKVASLLGAALALGATPLCAGFSLQGANQTSIRAVAPDLAAFDKDDPDSEAGDAEGGGVVDPTPQDDGSDGVDDGSGDG